MTEHSGAGFQSGFFGDLFSDILGLGRAFGGNDHPTHLTFLAAFLNTAVHIRIIKFTLRNDNIFGAGGQRHLKRDITAFIAHDLNDKNPFHTLRRVADLINGFKRSIDGRIGADRAVGAVDIIVDRTGNSDDGNFIFGSQFVRGAERAVAADDDQRVDVIFFYRLRRLGHAFGRANALGAGGFQNRAAAVDDVGHTAMVHLDDIVVQQAVVAFNDADHV